MKKLNSLLHEEKVQEILLVLAGFAVVAALVILT
jgi:hypothetical protein